jgi:hypothetical protein
MVQFFDGLFMTFYDCISRLVENTIEYCLSKYTSVIMLGKFKAMLTSSSVIDNRREKEISPLTHHPHSVVGEQLIVAFGKTTLEFFSWSISFTRVRTRDLVFPSVSSHGHGRSQAGRTRANFIGQSCFVTRQAGPSRMTTRNNHPMFACMARALAFR